MNTSLTIAGMIDHAVLHPAATTADFEKGLLIAETLQPAAFCVPSRRTAFVANRLVGTPVATCAVVGFPHGNAHCLAKLEEAKAALADGATEIDMVISIGDALDRNLRALETEIGMMNEAVVSKGALLKVIFETCYLTDDIIISLCEISSNCKVAFVKTSTGFGTSGATVHHVALMRANVPAAVGVKASGGIRTLVDAERLVAAGASRIGTSSTESIVNEERQKPRG